MEIVTASIALSRQKEFVTTQKGNISPNESIRRPKEGVYDWFTVTLICARHVGYNPAMTVERSIRHLDGCLHCRKLVELAEKGTESSTI